jgi:hypothetical protein
MTDKKTVLITEVFGESGRLVRLEAWHTDDGKHAMDAIWDPAEEQTGESRAEFRQWFIKILDRNGMQPLN